MIFVLVPEEVLETNINNSEAFELNTCTIWKFLMQHLGKFLKSAMSNAVAVRHTWLKLKLSKSKNSHRLYF